MATLDEMSQVELLQLQKDLQAEYDKLKGLNLNLDMSRGKPAGAQLNLSNDILTMPLNNYITSEGVDVRNYGILDGIAELKGLFSDLLNIPTKNIIVGGNSSLNLIYDSFARLYIFGALGSTPWGKLDKVKILCPVPGYDRHFSICDEFGFEMVPVPMTETGVDMDIVEDLVKNDPTVKGIICVPLYSNPDGICYSDETVERLAKMETAAEDFKIFWDEAYIVHHLTDEIIETPVLLNESKQYGTEDRVFMFTSTSKITFPGAGVSALACSEAMMKYICKRFSVMIISYDKMNQLRHVRFLKNKEGVLAHMAKHRRRLVPCFDAVKTAFNEELTPCGDIAHWTNPKGGYFISLYVMPGCAKRVAQLCKDCGLTLTGAGSAYPYHKDPDDAHLRIAPTYPSLDEVETASDLLCVCVRLAAVEKLLAEKA